MERRSAPVVFGLPTYGAEYSNAMQRDFPHSLLYVEGGCVTDTKFLHAQFPWFVCPECKRAEREWAEKHSDTREGKAILSGKDPTGLDVPASSPARSNQSMKPATQIKRRQS